MLYKVRDAALTGSLRAVAVVGIVLGAVMPIMSCETTNGESPPVSAGRSCDAREISGDLDLPDYQRNARAEVTECEWPWAVIRWEVPGDSQRMVHLVDAKWRTYVAFPHRTCWDDARADGVPMAFQKYFGGC
ncbi:hypothetical protein [Micromonospora sp. WMMD736]|uniref:hypothetical protein n=1 Tax=Micromonospora sp. WMMD736 TaxID=3404112 RepID=UPI003B92B9AC